MMSRSPLLGVVFAAVFTACSSGSTNTPTPPPKGIGDGETPGSSGTQGGADAADDSGALSFGGSSSGASMSGGVAGSSGGAEAVAGPMPGGASGSAGSATDSTGGVGGDGGLAGILTAGAWDDNRNFDLFLTYRAQIVPTLPGAPPISEQEHQTAYALWSQPRAAKTTLDVSLVIDTTGSMGDELSYLQSEFLALHASIEAKYPNAAQRWSLVVYRDVIDIYVVRWFDFRTDPNDFDAHLAAQSADGGGDYPESPEQALETASQLAWRDDSTAKLAFWVTDAPHHDANAATMAQSLRDIAARGIHLYPIAASGADDLTQLTMRAGAQITGGRFLFLTDDSGVGDSHAVPLIPCFFVTKLNAAILRMVDIELTGQYREPDAVDVIRTGGDPQSGRCTLSDGTQASIF